jgi:hypothetical protein
MRKILLVLIGASLLFADSKTDSSTGLMWQDNSDAKTIKLNWQDALEYCQDLNLEGYSDWRLPAIKELQTLVDVSKYKPAIRGGFDNTASSNYWSSSVYVSDSSYAWYVGFSSGYTYYFGNKTHKYYVRCVRAGQ